MTSSTAQLTVAVAEAGGATLAQARHLVTALHTGSVPEVEVHVYDLARGLVLPAITTMAKGRPDCFWSRHRTQALEVLGAAIRGVISTRGAELALVGWGAEARVAELAGRLARGAWFSGDGVTDPAAVAAGKELSVLGHRALAVALWRALLLARRSLAVAS